MKTYVERIVKIGYAVEDTKFETDEELNAFYTALGRMVAYAMASDQPRDIELVTMNIDKRHEITGAYFKQWKRGETYDENRPMYKLDEALDEFRKGQPFVMGAVPRDEGVRYGFHS